MTLGNKVIIDSYSNIERGVSIGDNTIIGAGAVVKGNIPAGVIVVGNPGKIIGTTNEYAMKHLQAKDYIVH